MKRFFRAIRNNILYGVLVLIPVAAFILIAYYFFGIWNSILLPLSDQIGLSTLESRLLAAGLAFGALLIVCFILGAIIRTRLGIWTFEKLETNFLSYLPGYAVLSNILRGFVDDKNTYKPALVTVVPGGAAMLGFVVEDSDPQHVTVFVPSAPMMTIGQIYLVQHDRVQLIDGTRIDAASCVSQWGIGLAAFVSASGNSAPGTDETTTQ